MCAGHVPSDGLQQAYLSSRDELARGLVHVDMPQGLPGFLDDLGSLGCVRVLLTNSPLHGVRETVGRFGLEGRFDLIVDGAGKPGRWGDHIAAFDRLSGRGCLLSIGDHWDNDIAPVLAAGREAAYIGGTGRHGGATYRAALLPDMYGAILEGCASWDR